MKIYFGLFLISLLSLTFSKKEIMVYEFTSDEFPWEGGTISPVPGTCDVGGQITVSVKSPFVFFDNGPVDKIYCFALSKPYNMNIVPITTLKNPST